MRRLVALSVVPLLLFGTAACGSGGGDSAKSDSGDTISGVDVTGDVGQVPVVKIDAPLKIKDTEVQVIKTGDGNPVKPDQQALLHIYLANGTTGDKAATTYDQGSPLHVQQVSDGQLWPGVLDAIVGKPVGSRIAIAAVPKDAYGDAGAKQIKIAPADNVVFVVDIMSVEPTDVLDGPTGDAAADIPADIPTVEAADGPVTKVTFDKAAKTPSGKLQVITLIEGDGPPARDDSLVTFDYFGQIYGTSRVFDESFSKEPVTFPLGIGGLVKGWDEGLVGVKAGSRVLIIAPPAFGYGAQGNPKAGIKGTDTLAFVVDILGVDAPS